MAEAERNVREAACERERVCESGGGAELLTIRGPDARCGREKEEEEEEEEEEDLQRDGRRGRRGGRRIQGGEVGGWERTRMIRRASNMTCMS